MSDYIVSLYEPLIGSSEIPEGTPTIPFQDLANALSILWADANVYAIDDYISWDYTLKNPGGGNINRSKLHLSDGAEAEILRFLHVYRNLVPEKHDIYFYHMSMGHAIKVTANLTLEDIVSYLSEF